MQGAATLAGTLDVRLTDGYVPALGDTFFPVGWAWRVGQFTTHLLPTLTSGLAWDINYGATSLRLKVIQAPDCPEDLNNDGVIDLSDLSILLTHFGSTGGPADGDINGDGNIDLIDLSMMLTVFGTTC